MEYWIFAALAAAFILMLLQAPGLVWLASIGIWIVAGYFYGITNVAMTSFLVAFIALPAVIVGIKPLRQNLISPRILDLFKRILPKMSETERDALEAGTTWWDADLFSGQPNWKKLLAFPRPTLTVEEQSFLDHEVNTLCDMVDDWETTQVLHDLSPQAWQFIKDKGFLGMIIPKKYGGKEFSAYMHSQVIMKLSSRCSALAVSVMVPNSLGPAELLLHYGTDAQKDHYLPRLAAGLEVPCFALTGPYAGSDAAAIPDIGVICHGKFEGVETLGFRVTWSKRYITLGPIASLLGLAFHAQDPDKLLGTQSDLGITCALIPTDHDGVIIGRRHWPLNAVFQNGPTSGTEVFVPMHWVIGGQAQVGKGWRMLMECLAAGRAISLPASNVGMAKLAVRGTSAYAAIRRQFKTAIGKFEGVQEALARMGGNLYMMDAARQLSVTALDLGEKPAVLSAIAKYHVTERGRIVVNDGMDILGGKGICLGPRNFLARAYQQIPIGITVEGANILTRCLIIFGQGAIRSHPYVLKEMHATIEADQGKAIRDFDAAFFGHVGFVFSNLTRSILYGLTGAKMASAPDIAALEMHPYYRGASRMSTAFALVTDLSMFVLGETLKRRERISARLGDVLSQLVLISATLKRYEDDECPAADAPYVHWSVQDALYRAQQALIGVLENFPNRLMGRLLHFIVFPFGLPYCPPSDALGKRVADAMQTVGAARNRYLDGSYVGNSVDDPIFCVEMAFNLLDEVEEIELRLKPHIHSGRLSPIPQNLGAMEAWIIDAKKLGFIDSVDSSMMSRYAKFVDLSVQVDDFPQDFNAAADVAKRKNKEHLHTSIAA
jgi:acyl-CoA dehydrogenase